MSRVCRIDELPEDGARGFSVTVDGEMLALIVLRRGDQVYGYRNVCPHRGTTLDWLPDRFMSADGAYLQCATHAALFEPTSGRCVAGPCRGQGLTPVALEVAAGEVLLVGG